MDFNQVLSGLKKHDFITKEQFDQLDNLRKRRNYIHTANKSPLDVYPVDRVLANIILGVIESLLLIDVATVKHQSG